jgi:hypothetical protein
MKLKYTMVQVRSPLKSQEPLHVSSCLRVKCSAATERVELCLERSHTILTWFLTHHLEVSMCANTIAKIMRIILIRKLILLLLKRNNNNKIIVLPREAVAEVSKIGHCGRGALL